MNHAAPFQALIPRGGEAKPPSGRQPRTTKRDVISAQEQRTRAWDTGIPTACEAGVASSPDGPRSKDLLQICWLGDLLRWHKYDAGDHSVVTSPVLLLCTIIISHGISPGLQIRGSLT